MPHFVLRIQLGNAAMQDAVDVADAFTGVIVALERGTIAASISDRNGNTVGAWGLLAGDADIDDLQTTTLDAWPPS